VSIPVHVWQTASDWRALAQTIGVGVAASSRGEALRQLRRAALNELHQCDRELRIIEGPPPKESES
jgi:hypothetical protein